MVWVPLGRPITRQGTGQNHALATVANTNFVSVYLSPNLSAGDFDTKLAELEDTLRDIPGALVIGGDFNARSTEWGMLSTNSRGRAVLNMAARLGQQVAKQGSVFTYRRPGSILDVTFTSERVAGMMCQRRVSEELTGSDHQYILFELMNPEETRPAARPIGWNVKKLGIDS